MGKEKGLSSEDIRQALKEPSQAQDEGSEEVRRKANAKQNWGVVKMKLRAYFAFKSYTGIDKDELIQMVDKMQKRVLCPKCASVANDPKIRNTCEDTFHQEKMTKTKIRPNGREHHLAKADNAAKR